MTEQPSGSIKFGQHNVEPESLEEAKKWIDTLRKAYHRELAYAKRLEADLARQRDVVDFMLYWCKARGMHKAPWLERAKWATKELARRLAVEPHQ